MIIVKLMGGLGNQMFQYAVGRYLSHKHRVDLKLDLSYLNDKSIRDGFTIRDYELSVFKLNSTIANEQEVDKFLLLSKGLKRVFVKIQKKLFKREVIREHHFHFDEKIKDAGKESYLEGYFQTELYFKEIEDIIRTDFEFNVPLHSSSIELLEKIKSSNSVSVHFRRGDFLSNPEVLKHHGVCSLEYYSKAISLMNEKLSNPTFFIFSDDINWVKENFKGVGDFVYVERKNVPAYEDLRLMSNCKHNIIANSSFSWWAAWLNANKDKKVIAPEKYLNEPSYNLKDVIPLSWIKI